MQNATCKGRAQTRTNCQAGLPYGQAARRYTGGPANEASDSGASVHKLRILPAAQILDALRRNLASCSGTAFRRAQDSMTRGALALTSYGPCLLRFGRRLGRTPVLALTLEQLRIENISVQPRLPRFRCKAQCKMQLLDSPFMANMLYLMCVLFVRTFPRPDWAPPAARPRRRH